MMKNNILYIICLLFCVSGKAQISHGGTPLPLSITKSQEEDLFIQMPEFNLREQLRQDSLEASDFRNGYRFAYKFITDYTPDNSGIHFTLPDGTKVWRLGFYSPNAYSLNLLFSQYHLPEGARVYLYNKDQTEVLGSFTHLNNSELGLLPVAPIVGDRIIVEYQEPATVAFPGQLTIGEVNHGYRQFRISEPQPDQSNFWCMPPLACYQDTTEYYNTIERSVILLIINGTTSCTGTLVNNTAQDGKPYLLTASHCLNERFQLTNPDYAAVAGNIICYFNYNSPQCSPVEVGQTDQTMSSAYFRAANEKTDMALLELLEVPPTDYNVYYAGWNAQDKGVNPYVCIHHPGGSLKRLNQVDGDIELLTYTIQEMDFNPLTHWKVSRWYTGCTAAGSSGSPLIDGNNHVIGVLTGGSSFCSSPINDYFFALQKSWAEPADSSKQLKCWLDPIGLEIPICDGMDTNSSGTALEGFPIETELNWSIDQKNRTIHISFPAVITQASLTLITIEGKIVMQIPIHHQEATIKTGGISPGIYIAKVVYNNKVYTKKVLF